LARAHPTREGHARAREVDALGQRWQRCGGTGLISAMATSGLTHESRRSLSPLRIGCGRVWRSLSGPDAKRHREH
jgi:hypothetical protein